MRILKGLCFAAVGTSLLTYGGGAWAAEPAAGEPVAAGAHAEGGEGGMRLPVSFVERGITNPALILSPGLEFAVGHVTGGPAVASMTVGSGFSITDDFGVRATVASFDFNPKFQYNGVGVGATYRFVKGEFELGGAVDVGISTISGASGASFKPSVPMRLHIGKVASLDLQPGVTIDTAGANLKGMGTTTVVGLGIPVVFAYDIIEPLHVGATTGFSIFDFNDAGHTIGIPFGFIAGYAVAGSKGPILDIDPFFRWPALFAPGAPTGTDAVNAGDFDVGVEVTGYLYL